MSIMLRAAGLLVLALALPAAADTPSLEHPMAPSFVSLRDGRARRVVFQARWKGPTGPMDPTTQGGTLRIVGGDGEGDSGLVSLDAGHWHARKHVLRYDDATGAAAGIRSVVLRIGRKGGLVRVSGRGAWPYAVDKAQTKITVTLTIGASRWCAGFDGSNLKNGRHRVEGHTKTAPQSCPC